MDAGQFAGKEPLVVKTERIKAILMNVVKILTAFSVIYGLLEGSVIAFVKKAVATSNTAVQGPFTTSKIESAYVYKTKRGDTVDHLRLTHRMSRAQVVGLNPDLSNLDEILADETELVLRAQGTYVVERGDTFETLAEHFGITPSELKRANNRKSAIIIGEMLIIPYHVHVNKYQR